MSNYPSKYFRFSGHALGVAARFNQLDEMENINDVIRKVETATHGRDLGKRFETEVEADVEELRLVEKLNIGYIHLHFLSKFDSEAANPVSVVTTKGSRIEGLQMGQVKGRTTSRDERQRSVGLG